MSTRKTKPIASLSLDLDNQWSYMKTHGNAAWEKYPSYLDWAVPRILEFLDQRDLKITFFIVGKDADIEVNRKALRAIADAGHEIGNHSFNHEPWLHLYSEEDLDKELDLAEAAIESATGVKPCGFRGPGFSLSPSTLRVLQRRGYRYDATVFPNLLNPLARAYFFATSSLTKEEKEQRKALFGTWRDALRPVAPFRWQIEDESLLELPVTTMPIFKTPIHLSYILYASRYSKVLAMLYFRFALFMCRVTGVAPSILLHPLDFIGSEDVTELDFFPGMDLPKKTKIDVVDKVIGELRKHYELGTVREHVDSTGPNLKRLDLQVAAS
jgi:peptidoglycan-N-acetylglucosamine deacetylase